MLEILNNSLLDGLTPLVFEVVSSGCDGAILGTLKIADAHCVGDVGVVDVAKIGVVAFLADDLLHADDLVLAQECVEAELRELFGEVVRRDVNQTKVGLLLRCWIGG